MTELEYRQVDVFAERPLAGNGLAVFLTDDPLGERLMQQITCELRQFESIFLVGRNDGGFDARVFTMEEELPFAGHPAIGAAAVLHERQGSDTFACDLHLPSGTVALESKRTGRGYRVRMHQGAPGFGVVIPQSDEESWLELFGIGLEQRDRSMPLCVATTGLPYLVVPVTSEGLARARIRGGDLEERLSTIGAKFAYLLDVEAREGRTWDNDGRVEDIATGSAAGPIAALLVHYGLAAADETILLAQGRMLGRPSEMQVEVRRHGERMVDVLLSGDVCMVATGRFDRSLFA